MIVINHPTSDLVLISTFFFAGPEGKWLIEGHGLDPDFVTDDLPFESYKGKDAQLKFAVDYLRKQIAAQLLDELKAPPHPDKAFKY